MKSGYIYALQNNIYEPHLVKIGLTTREPDVRARELYAGHSGVPLPFKVATAYSVGDTKLAEKRLHKRLKAFRINNRREFFRIPPLVAFKLILETCNEVNKELRIPPPQQFLLSSPHSNGQIVKREHSLDNDLNIYKNKPVYMAKLKQLQESPINTSTLNSEQLDRIYITKLILETVFPQSLDKWNEGFTRDKHPEREIRIWECITKAFITIDQVGLASNNQKNEAFHLLLLRSSVTTKKALEVTTLKYINKNTAKTLLAAYEMIPKPVGVSFIR